MANSLQGHAYYQPSLREKQQPQYNIKFQWKMPINVHLSQYFTSNALEKNVITSKQHNVSEMQEMKKNPSHHKISLRVLWIEKLYKSSF